MEAEGNWEYAGGLDPLLCLCSSKQTLWKAMPMQRSKKLKKRKKKEKRFDKTIKTKPLALDILMRYSVRYEIHEYEKKKKKKQNKKQRNDTSQGITGNVLHFKSCTKKKM